jgi:hypothetical protein
MEEKDGGVRARGATSLFMKQAATPPCTPTRLPDTRTACKASESISRQNEEKGQQTKVESNMQSLVTGVGVVFIWRASAV